MILMVTATTLIITILDFFIHTKPKSTDEIIFSVILFIIVILSAVGVFYLLKSFIVINIEASVIKIKYLFLFRSKKIELFQLVNWEELEQKQNYIILYKNDLKKITIYSLNCWNYENFKEQLAKVLIEKEIIELNYSNKF
ncbi:MAG: hypothetical protein EAZ27_05725 [Cytophagales bacterium]|nr:MAG: hypothetical protein EAZ27_05725 [Cytophagales bacterium]